MPILNYKGEDGQFHSLGGLLKGDPGNAGVVVGDTEPTDPSVKVWINSAGNPMTAEQIPVSSTDNSSVATALGNKVPSSRTINGKPLNSDVVLIASDLEGAAADSNKLGGKDPKYYIQPPNLLDNSDFRNPVMQTGFNGMHGTQQYIVDRWQHTGGVNAVQASDGIILTSETIYARARQIIVSSNLVGKPVTLAVYKTDGGVCCASAVVPNTISDSSFLWFENNELILALTCITEGQMNVDIATKNAISVSIKAVALYEGTYTADTLPPYVPKGYAAELAECLRYFERLGSTYSEQIGNIVYVASGAKSFVCSLQCSGKRIKHPSVSISGVDNYRLLLKDATNASTYSADSISSIDDITTQEPFISFRVNMVGTLAQNSWIQFQRHDGATAAYIDVSADL